jgi:hypothetical protein
MKIVKNYLFSYAALSLVSCALIFLTNRYILTSDFFIVNRQYLSGIPGQETAVYQSLQKWIYLSTIIYLSIRIGTVVLLLYTALYLADVAISLRKLLSEIIFAEFIFILPAGIKFLHFYQGHQPLTLTAWHRYYPLSTLSLLGEVPADWHYALQTLNIFEVAYWFLLARGIQRATGIGFNKSLNLVIYAYLPPLVIWVAAVTFLSIVYFPGTA